MSSPVQTTRPTSAAQLSLAYSLLLVLADALLKEVRLPLQADELHPVEGVRGVV